MEWTKEMRKAFQTPQVKSIVPMLNRLQNSSVLNTKVALERKANNTKSLKQTPKPKRKRNLKL